MRRFCYEHSLSISTFLGYLICQMLTLRYEAGSRPYDFWMMWSGSFHSACIIVILARVLWEKDSDPTKPPNADDSDR